MIQLNSDNGHIIAISIRVVQSQFVVNLLYIFPWLPLSLYVHFFDSHFDCELLPRAQYDHSNAVWTTNFWPINGITSKCTIIVLFAVKCAFWGMLFTWRNVTANPMQKRHKRQLVAACVCVRACAFRQQPYTDSFERCFYAHMCY